MGGSDPDPPTNPNPPPGDRLPCPLSVIAILPNPGGLAEGQPLAVVLDRGPPSRAMIHTTNGVRLGPVAGAPDLHRLLSCLQEGVAYNAHVERIDDAAVTCVLTLASG